MAWWLVLCLVLVSSLPAQAAEPLKVAVAANLRPAFEQLVARFKAETEIEVEASYGASGKFVAQIEAGAPFDLFLSADADYPAALYAAGHAVLQPKVYAYGRLVLWTTRDLDLSAGLRALAAPDIEHIAIGNPKVSPYGRASLRAFEQAGLSDVLTKKLVYGESLAQVMQFVESQAADVGLTAKSLVLAPEVRDKGRWVALPNDLVAPIPQAVVMLKHSALRHASESQRLFDFLFSAQAQAVLSEHGYDLP